MFLFCVSLGKKHSTAQVCGQMQESFPRQNTLSSIRHLVDKTNQFKGVRHFMSSSRISYVSYVCCARLTTSMQASIKYHHLCQVRGACVCNLPLVLSVTQKVRRVVLSAFFISVSHLQDPPSKWETKINAKERLFVFEL